MRLQKGLIWCLLLAVSSLTTPSTSASAAEAFRLSPNASVRTGMDWSALWITGEMLVPGGGQPGSGTKVDVSSELGVEYGEASACFLHATLLEKHLLSIDYLMFAPTGLKKTANKFRFQNKTYPAGTVLETRLDFNWVRAAYGYKFFDMSTRWIAPRIGVHYVNCGATINGESTEAGSISNSRRLDAVYPVVGLEARYLLPLGVDLSVEVEGVHMITIGYLAMFKAGVSWEVHPDLLITLSAASRLVQSVEDNQILNNEWFYNISGFTAGVGIGF